MRTLISTDDLLWLENGLTWRGKTKSIEAFIESPEALFKSLDTKVPDIDPLTHKQKIDPEGNPIWISPPALPRRYTMPFKLVPEGSNELGITIQGIHHSSYVTVRVLHSSVMSDTAIVSPAIPSRSPIQITLVPSRNLAYIHWEVSTVSPTTPTTIDELMTHLYNSVVDFHRITNEYDARLSVFPYENASVREVNDEGHVMPTLVKAPFEVKYDRLREVLLEGEHYFDEERDGGNSLPISCNIDIGTYTIDPVTGVITIIVDSSIVKFYP